MKNRRAIPLAESGSSLTTGRMLDHRCRLTMGVCAALYIAALIWSHRTVIAPFYEYMGLHFAPQSVGCLAFGIMAALLPVAWMDMQLSRPSTMVYFLLFALLYVPACVVPPCTLRYNVIWYTEYISYMSGCFWLLQKICTRKPVDLSRFRLSPPQFSMLLLALTLGATALILRQHGLRFHAPSLSSEMNSEIREEFGDVVQRGSIWLAYVMPVLSKVFAPASIVYGLVTRKWILVIAGSLSEIVIYMHTGHKMVLLSPLLLVALYFAMQIWRKKLFLNLLAGLTLMIVGTAGVDMFVATSEATPRISSLFVRRMILVPGQLSGYYFDFFSENPKALLGHSILQEFVEYPYEDSPPRIIMKTYFTFDGRANAGLWSDGYANFGFAGMILATLILGSAMWAYDSAAQGVDRRIATLLLVMPALAVVNSAILTVLLTHGLFAAIVLVSLMPRSQTK